MSDVSSWNTDFLSHPSFHLLLSFPLLEHSFSCLSLAVELGVGGRASEDSCCSASYPEDKPTSFPGNRITHDLSSKDHMDILC